MAEDRRIFWVSELNNYIKQLFEADELLAGVLVRGELSNYKTYPSGHHYFTLKDSESTLRCVMFRGNSSKLRFRPENGMKTIAFGRVSVYPRDGAYQLYVSELIPDGIGDLHVAFEQLKEELFKEGLFDERFKKPIPRFPKRIAVITSPVGAAVRDIIRVLGKRFPIAEVIILPVRVQGQEAPAEIAEAIRYANEHHVADVIITGRGGGSIEDLWAFNDRRVVKAIFASEIPVISAVGHEPDVTISDFVADLRAATPSNAAELCVPDSEELRAYLATVFNRMSRVMERRVTLSRQLLKSAAGRRMLSDPMNYLDGRREIIDRMSAKLLSAAERYFTANHSEYVALASKLDALSPLKVLGRGYAIALTERDAVVRSSADVQKGSRIRIRLRSDEISCTVD